ncbi:MAG: hypothetical protein ABIO39_11890 [Caulobacteraceae bacterium]
MNRRGLLKLMAGGSVGALAAATGPVALAAAPFLYKDPKAPIPLRVADLLGRMTLEEKVVQIRSVSRDDDPGVDAHGW